MLNQMARRAIEFCHRAQERRAAAQLLRETVRRADELAEEMKEQHQRLEAALTNMPHGFCMFDADLRLIISNGRYAEMYQLPPDLVRPGTSLQSIVAYRHSIGNGPKDFPDYVTHHRRDATVGGTIAVQFPLEDGRTIRVSRLALSGGGYVATHEDVTETVRAEARISHMARHDVLTNLPNRVCFREKLEEVLRVASPGHPAAVLCLDVDHFKAVNEAFGHPVGDALLLAAADRLRDCAGKMDAVARLDGDEFATIQVGRDQPAGAAELAQKIIEAISRPYHLNGHEVAVGGSIGIALVPDDGYDADQLLKNANMALSRAQSEERGTYCFFEPAMDLKMQARRQLEIGLRKALDRGEFELHYQPLLNLQNNSITGCEALLRWRDPERGLIPPADFIPLAEETGLIIPIGDWVIRQACADAATWPGSLRVAVNLSAVQFRNPRLVSVIFSALAASHLPASRLELEITESVLLKNNERTLSVLHQLHDFGVRVSMDDFGTGYSSLSYLRSFPFDKIKIDQSFIRDLSHSDHSLAIVRAVTGLAAAFGMTTTAEGVEASEQLDCLRREGCTEAQGYLFSRPIPSAQLHEFFLNPKWPDSVAA
ncbi:MAG: hypothetical protein QOD94_276 [Alphaproteobacteria bacterium]|jgi:diguanylate cyclase (GGDEF)-like protein|nr:hypothetical protein [Alphaproteobacteria bacterium]